MLTTRESSEGRKVDLAELVESGAVDTMIVAFPDHLGRLMGKRLSAGYYLDRVARSGVHACNYLLASDMELNPLAGFRLASWEQGYGDFKLKPDPSTVRVTPWLDGTACVLCDIFAEDGRPVEESPRRMLRRQIEEAEAMGFVPEAASELEFFLFKDGYEDLASNGYRFMKPTTDYIIDYYILGTTADEALLRQIRNEMNTAGIMVEGSKGEWGKGQHEVNLAHCGVLEMADRHVLFKEGVKLLAARHSVSATFMAKVHPSMAGSSCHLHTNLKHMDGSNAFWDQEKDEPSEIFRWFLAGCMEYARHLSLFFAPTVNSYKRYQAISFAPVSVAWGPDNRTCGFRTVGKGSSFRIENRIPGADVNPYLAFAATLAAGLAGIRKKLDLRPPTPGNAYTTEGVERVPSTFVGAIGALSEGSMAKEVFGAECVEHYLHMACLEQAALDCHVTDWELARYFQRI